MKKTLFALAAVAMMMATNSCKNDATTASQDNNAETEQVEPIEQEVAPVTEANDSTTVGEIKTTASGLKYRVIKEGQGAHPAANSNVSVKYTGKHTDGSVFDSSNGQAVTFNLQQVIPGFTEGLMLMNKGAQYELIIPGELAYGPNGIPQAGIGPNETLVFEIELVDFQ